MTRSVGGWRLHVHIAIAALVFAATLAYAPAARAEDGNIHVLFTQQDEVQAFDLATGKGYQIGTARGEISGTTYVAFQFAPTGAPDGDALPIAFQNKVTITDLDGDQLFFENDGTGTFHLGIPGFAFSGSGGPLTGTYVVTGGTGKFADWSVGKTFDYRAIATNPPLPNALGNVYVRISYHDRGQH